MVIRNARSVIHIARFKTPKLPANRPAPVACATPPTLLLQADKHAPSLSRIQTDTPPPCPDGSSISPVPEEEKKRVSKRFVRDTKAHKLLSINLLTPTLRPHFGPLKKVDVSLSWAKCRKVTQTKLFGGFWSQTRRGSQTSQFWGRKFVLVGFVLLVCLPWVIRRESSGGMEWLGVWSCIFSGSEFWNFGAWNLAKIAFSAEFQGFSWKFRSLKNIFRTLENGHSIRHQPIPPLSAGRVMPCTDVATAILVAQPSPAVLWERAVAWHQCCHLFLQ